MKNKIVSLNSDFSEISIKLSLIDSNSSLYVLDENGKLFGIISKQDIASFLKNSQYRDSCAKDVCNTNYTYFRFEHLENDIIEILSIGNIDIKEFPIVDNEGRFITTINSSSLGNYLNWINSQKYEIAWWTRRLRTSNPQRKAQIEDKRAMYINKRYREDLLPISDPKVNIQVFEFIKEKTCLEIGCGPVGGFIATMWQAAKRIAIEPLCDNYRELIKNNFGYDIFNHIDEIYNMGADVYIPELENCIDGMIFCNNALDHTPNWVFILSNIALYAKSGCYFHLWTDIAHSEPPNEGHYNITINKDNILRLVKNLGFEILSAEVNKPMERSNLYIKLLGVKK